MPFHQAAAGRSDPLAALRRRLLRRTLGLVLLTAGEIVFSAGILTLLAAAARRTPTPLDLAAFASLALLAIGAQAWALWNRRGLWRAHGESALVFVDFSILRCRRRLRSVRFGVGLLAAETLVFLFWFFLNPAAWSGFALGLLAACVAVTALVLALFARYSRAELDALSKLRDEIVDG
ncbi:MAG TPA: hypothetical protein VGS22_24025 [Thermoanaerobaculia bacterium]|jgi:hypothetical protein|nr:hypothetical protein [Thermoanaerobaculia bacterium]